MKNISLNRVFSNNDNSVNFSEISNNFPKPDLVICAFPILGLVKEVTNFCGGKQCPLDIRYKRFLARCILGNSTKNIKTYSKFNFLEILI